MTLGPRRVIVWGYYREHPMGILADSLRARLTDMQARHAETDRQIAIAKAEAEQAFRAWQRAADALDAELTD